MRKSLSVLLLLALSLGTLRLVVVAAPVHRPAAMTVPYTGWDGVSRGRDAGAGWLGPRGSSLVFGGSACDEQEAAGTIGASRYDEEVFPFRSEEAGAEPQAVVRPGISISVAGKPQGAPTPLHPEDVLWDQYYNWSGVDLAAQDFESSYDAYDIWAGDDFQNLEAWTIDTVVGRGGWGAYVNLANATAIHWYICPDNAGLPGCVPGDGNEYWDIHLAPSDPQVGLSVFEAEDFVLTLDTPINLPSGTWWIVFQVSLEYALYGQYGISSTSDPPWGHAAMQINPNDGFGNGPDWFDNDYGYDVMFRLEGTVGGVQEPDIRVEPTKLIQSLSPGEQRTVELHVCNDGTVPLQWSLEEIPAGYLQDVLWDNGPLVTHPGGGYGGADASVLQTNLGLSTYGFGHQYSYGYRIADDFVADGDWTIDHVTFFAYQTNSPTDPSTFTAYNLAVWDGLPGGGGSIVWGSYVDNCMIDTAWMGAYRVTDYDMMGTARPIMANICETPGLVLPPGHYWLDWQADGTLTSGPWAPPISLLGETTTGDGLQSLDGGSTWEYVLDTGTSTQQGIPFIIEGAVGGEPGIPWLSEDPISGTAAPGDCQVVDVTFDAAGLEPDVYTGELLIESNDPQEPEVWIPVTLTVNGGSGPPWWVFLPLAARQYITYFEGPWEAEPNNAYGQANGPLRSARDYFGYPNDDKDYFSIFLPAGGDIAIDLAGHTGTGVQLQLFWQNVNNRVAYDLDPPYHIDYSGGAGWYYIYIYTAGGWNSSYPYTLHVTYP